MTNPVAAAGGADECDAAEVRLEARPDRGSFAVAAAVMGEPRKGDRPNVVVEHGTNACAWGARLHAVVTAAAAETALARLRPILQATDLIRG